MLRALRRPIFITGIPRSGSTFLHELMAEDPENRAPRVWEVMFPIAAQSDSSREADRWVRKAETSLWWFRRLAPRADAVYPMRARTPHECVAIHSYTLLSEEFASTCHIPTYEAFLRSADLVPTYSWQKRFLQYLQLRRKTRQWVLKSPDHVHGLEDLFAVFPDAVIVQTHRDPLDALRSAVQLAEVLEGLFTRPGDPGETGLHEAAELGGGHGEYDRVSRGSSRTGGAVHRCEIPRTGVRSFVGGAADLPATRDSVNGGGRRTNAALGFDAVTVQRASRESNVSGTWSR